MISRRLVQIIAGITAIIGLLVSALYGGHESASMALRIYSYGTSVSLLLLLAYEHYIWHLPPIRKLTGRPDLRGTWKGQLRSSYTVAGSQVDPILTILRVRQTASSQTITLFTSESASVTEQSQLAREPDGRWQLSWTYSNTPRTSARDRSECHLGTAEVIYDPDHGLAGSYYTDRLTRGELELTLRSRQYFSSVKAADAAVESFR